MNEKPVNWSTSTRLLPSWGVLQDGRLLVRWDQDPLVAAVGCRAYVGADGLVVILGSQNTDGQDCFRVYLRRDYGALTEQNVTVVATALYGSATVPAIQQDTAGVMVTSVFFSAPKPSLGPVWQGHERQGPRALGRKYVRF